MPEFWDHFWNHNNEEDFEDMGPEVDGWAEEYDEEKHGGKIFESQEDIARLQKECDALNVY